VQPTGRVRESLGWLGIWAQFLETSGLGEVIASDVWVSHLDDLELSALTELSGRGTTLRSRLGTRLWLGDPEAAVAKATVLGVHRVAKGDRVGYRQVRAPRNCWLVVLGGGTAHGVAMEAPASPTSVRRRVVSAGTGALEAVGRALSPYSIGGRQRWFAEPPHMQVSLVWLPKRVTPPAVGDEVDVVVRMTTAHFDRIVGLD